MIRTRDYIQEVDGTSRVSLFHWGMFPIEVPNYSNQIIDEEISSSSHKDFKQAVFEDFAFRMPSMMRGMKKFKEGVASYANNIGDSGGVESLSRPRDTDFDE